MKTLGEQKVIYFRLYNGFNKTWETYQFSNGRININPCLGLFEEIAYQTIKDSISRISFANYVRDGRLTHHKIFHVITTIQ